MKKIHLFRRDALSKMFDNDILCFFSHYWQTRKKKTLLITEIKNSKCIGWQWRFLCKWPLTFSSSIRTSNNEWNQTQFIFRYLYLTSDSVYLKSHICFLNSVNLATDFNFTFRWSWHTIISHKKRSFYIYSFFPYKPDYCLYFLKDRSFLLVINYIYFWKHCNINII